MASLLLGLSSAGLSCAPRPVDHELDSVVGPSAVLLVEHAGERTATLFDARAPFSAVTPRGARVALLELSADPEALGLPLGVAVPTSGPRRLPRPWRSRAWDGSAASWIATAEPLEVRLPDCIEAEPLPGGHCRVPACGAGFWDGGLGACVERDTCIAGFVLEELAPGDARCVPACGREAGCAGEPGCTPGCALMAGYECESGGPSTKCDSAAPKVRWASAVPIVVPRSGATVRIENRGPIDARVELSVSAPFQISESDCDALPAMSSCSVRLDFSGLPVWVIDSKLTMTYASLDGAVRGRAAARARSECPIEIDDGLFAAPVALAIDGEDGLLFAWERWRRAGPTSTASEGLELVGNRVSRVDPSGRLEDFEFDTDWRPGSTVALAGRAPDLGFLATTGVLENSRKQYGVTGGPVVGRGIEIDPGGPRVFAAVGRGGGGAILGWSDDGLGEPAWTTLSASFGARDVHDFELTPDGTAIHVLGSTTASDGRTPVPVFARLDPVDGTPIRVVRLEALRGYRARSMTVHPGGGVFLGGFAGERAWEGFVAAVALDPVPRVVWEDRVASTTGDGEVTFLRRFGDLVLAAGTVQGDLAGVALGPQTALLRVYRADDGRHFTRVAEGRGETMRVTALAVDSMGMAHLLASFDRPSAAPPARCGSMYGLLERWDVTRP